MAGQSLTTFTPKSGEHFGGASLIDYTTLLGLAPCEAGTYLSTGLSTGTYFGSAAGVYGGENVYGVIPAIANWGLPCKQAMTYDITEPSTLSITPQTAIALLCVYLLTKLDEDRLKEALESLDDIYKMQEESRTIANGGDNEIRFVPASTSVARVPDAPFVR